MVKSTIEPLEPAESLRPERIEAITRLWPMVQHIQHCLARRKAARLLDLIELLASMYGIALTPRSAWRGPLGLDRARWGGAMARLNGESARVCPYRRVDGTVGVWRRNWLDGWNLEDRRIAEEPHAGGARENAVFTPLPFHVMLRRDRERAPIRRPNGRARRRACKRRSVVE
jgi:ribosome modulation factor